MSCQNTRKVQSANCARNVGCAVDLGPGGCVPGRVGRDGCGAFGANEDGFAVCEKLEADPQLADVPAILLTSLPDGLGPMGKLAKRPCVADYLEKPVKPVELLKRVGKFLAEGEQESGSR